MASFPARVISVQQFYFTPEVSRTSTIEINDCVVDPLHHSGGCLTRGASAT
jgi:hypothetical protein